MKNMPIIKLLLIFLIAAACGNNGSGDKKMNEKKSNRLIHEKSPYLLQHAYNPVDWYPWGEEAFQKAKDEDKPIFLSIGYSTCHWCHVMEHESFEDSTVAELMNEVFVSIKVDREERPDIDNIYMTVCQMMSGHGGWPLTIIMTPDKKPFFAGTYFPKESKYGRIGLIDLINRVKEAWKSHRDDILASANKISDYLIESRPVPSESILDKSTMDKAFASFSSQYDEKYGGFGNEPKFPSPHNFLFLLRYWNGTGNEKALNMVTNTLSLMRLGGVYDHIGGGFHRYSTDRKWFLPHFEKMLYDQGMLALAFTEAYSANKNILFKETADEIFNYVLRDMTSPEGAFYSAEDADSDGEEGKFYVWTTKEIRDILSNDDADLFIDVYNLEEEGNYFDESTRQKNGTNIPYLRKSLEDITKEKGFDTNTFLRKIKDIKQKLFKEREKRIHPLKDDKILTDWNGLMITALASAGRTFENGSYIDAAKKAFGFIENNLIKEHLLLHRYRNGEAAIDGQLDDYAYLIMGALELYQSTFNPRYLKIAVELNETVLEKFYDKEHGGFFLTANDAEKLLMRPKDIYDGAIPSGNSIAYYNLLRLYQLTANDKYLKYIEELERLFSGMVAKSPTSFSMFLSALSGNIYSAKEIVIVEGENGIEEFIHPLANYYTPNSTVLVIPSGKEKEVITELAPFTKEHTAVNGLTTVYVCKNFVCNLPTTEPEEMIREISIK